MIPRDPTPRDTLPTPLVRAMAVFEADAAADRPFRAVHRLIDAIEVLCKLYTVAGLARFVEVLGEQLGGDTLPDAERVQRLDRIRAMLASGLRTPSLGIWWGFARETAKALDELGEPHILPGAKRVLHEKGFVSKAFQGKDDLIAFRNGYAHGATPSDAQCQADLDRYGPRLQALVEQSAPLAGATLAVVGVDGRLHAARGPSLTPLDATHPKLVPGHCVLLVDGRPPLSLHPLLTYRPGAGDDGAFFFYNDLRKNHASTLNYPHALHHRDVVLRGDLLARFPLDDWKALGGAELDPFRERIAALTEVFKGRTTELQALATFLAETDRGFHVVWGPPGVGKSTLLARTIELLRWTPELRDQASPGLTWPALELTVVEYFIRRGSTDTATALLDSLNQRLDARFGLRLPLGNTDTERRQQLIARLTEVSRRLQDHQRLVLVVDGLDEARRDDPLLGSLPRDVPPGVVVIYGSRPQKLLKYGFYEELDRERRSEVDLAGLTLADTRALLYAHVDKYALEADYARAVLARSEGNPLYLKLLCQGLEQGIYALNATDALPTGMTELYKNALVRIHDTNPDATRLLTLLAAARDFVSPAMMGELMGLSESAVVAGPLAACLELLYENPLTEDLLDYQLFHESLREHLRHSAAKDVTEWETRLADWAAHWRDAHGDPCHQGDRQAYAMAWAVPHLADCRARAEAHGQISAATRRGDTILALVEDEDWRSACFRACGNGAPLQRALRLAQQVVRARDTDGSERPRMLRFARWLHDEPDRLSRARRDQLRTPAPRGRDRAWLEEVVQLARMGARPRDRVLLALTALWAPLGGRPVARPKALDQAVAKWLEEAREPALDKLWTLSGGER